MEYKDILDFESSKLLGLFNLLKSTDKNSSLEQLSEKLEVNVRTIIRSIKKLKNLFKRYELNEHLKIRRHSKKYFYLKRENDLYLELFLVQYLSELPEIIFLKAVIEVKTIKTKRLAEKLHISESSMRRRVKKVNEWLTKFNIHLKRGTYELMGEEEQIRAWILHFYWFAYQGTKNKFLLIGKDESWQLTHLLVKFFQMQINDLQKESLFRIVQIASWRYKNGEKISIKKEWMQYTENSSVFSKFIATMEVEKCVRDWNLEELAYLYIIIQAKFLPYFGSSIQAYIIEEHYVKKTTCYVNTLVATNIFRQVFWGKKFSHSKSSVVAFFGFHLYYEVVSGLPYERERSKETLQENYPSFICKVDEGLCTLVMKNRFYLRIPKDALFYRYFMILSTLISPVYNEKRIFVCLMTDLSIEQENGLGKRIVDFFSSKYNLVVSYARTAQSIAYTDIILTTVVYEALKQKYAQPILLIDGELSEALLFQIEKLLKKVRK